ERVWIEQAGGSRPIAGDGIGDVLFIAYSDNPDIDNIAKYQRIRLRLQLIRNENITVRSFDGQYPSLAWVIDNKIEMVRFDLLNGSLRIFDQLLRGRHVAPSAGCQGKQAGQVQREKRSCSRYSSVHSRLLLYESHNYITERYALFVLTLLLYIPCVSSIIETM